MPQYYEINATNVKGELLREYLRIVSIMRIIYI